VKFWQNCIKILFISAAMLFAATGCSKQDNNIQKLAQPKQDIHGQQFKFSMLKGKWTIVNYWAAWCKPCLKEIPELNKLQQAHATQLQVIGVSFDPLTKQKIQHYVKLHQISYTMLATLPIKQLGIEHVKALPATFVFTPQGKLYKTIYGEVTKASLEKVVFSPKTS